MGRLAKQSVGSLIDAGQRHHTLRPDVHCPPQGWPYFQRAGARLPRRHSALSHSPVYRRAGRRFRMGGTARQWRDLPGLPGKVATPLGGVSPASDRRGANGSPPSDSSTSIEGTLLNGIRQSPTETGCAHHSGSLSPRDLRPVTSPQDSEQTSRRAHRLCRRSAHTL